ncbi:winged helix-turn-helix transcriptional regulator [Streptomyces sp. SID3343]|uniref:winged helix-turn-helix transcriptional regulator n=1 Tax=Streptomyces sp. SID3343 TaxID=2690260 RepID=UPI0013697D74|nr:winged helix-turn-helix transcriptional regulator [Streptomyces sp. SID3343]MYW03358.1 hypothetical protein [Streptomyces sp. SID3343]MYW06236.1 hypothetical protein [Streptomyces sp. SID3343]
MPTITSPLADEHTERAVAMLNPRWSTWVLQTMAQTPGEHLRTGEVARALPWLSVSLVSQRIARLAQDGLVEAATHQGRHSGYRLTTAGRSLEPVHTSLAAWSREHLAHTGPLPQAEAAEQTLAALRNRHTLPILQVLRDRDLVRFGDLKQAAPGLQDAMLGLRLHQLQDDGLVARTDGHRGQYALTERGRALDPVIGDLTVWAHRHIAPANSPSPTAVALTAVRTSARPTTPPNAPAHDATRSAATGRSTVHVAVFAVTFSHPGDTLGPGPATPTVAGPPRAGQRR